MSVASLIRQGLGSTPSDLVRQGLESGTPPPAAIGPIIRLGLGYTPSDVIRVGLGSGVGGAGPAVPTSVVGTPTSGTTATTTWAHSGGGETGFQVQIAPVSTGIYEDALGATNPTAPGVLTFAHTGLTAYTLYTSRVRARGIPDSAYAVSAQWATDNTGTGGGEISAFAELSIAGGTSGIFSGSASSTAAATLAATGGTGTFSGSATGPAVASLAALGGSGAFSGEASIAAIFSMAATGGSGVFSGEASVPLLFELAALGGSGTFSALLIGEPITTSTADRDARRLQRRKTLRATASREVNLMWRRKEPADEREPFYREQVPGLTVFAEIGGGAYRGGWSLVSRAFAVFGAGFYEITAGGTYTLRGTLATSTGPVDMVQGVGLIVIVDGPNGYTFALGANTFARITDPNFLGSKRVGYLDGRFVFVQPDSQLFYWTKNIDDGSTFDALDFASAESAPDLIVGHVVDHREIWFLGEKTGEPWVSAPTSDGVPYQRNSGAIMETGLAATHSLQRLDNSIYWVGRDSNGEGMVFVSGGAGGYQPMRISDHSVEEVLNKSADLAGCYAYTYQDAGQTFYCLQVPGAESTLIYDVSVKRWHERAELIGGNLAPWRVTGMLFAFGKHLAGGSDGVLYELNDYEYTYAGDVMYRGFVTPHTVTPGLRDVYFSRLELNMTTGETASGLTPSIEMRYSNNGGKTWANWMSRSAGEIGEFGAQPKWLRLGRGPDRVWEFRITDDCKAAIVGMNVEATEGAV